MRDIVWRIEVRVLGEDWIILPTRTYATRDEAWDALRDAYPHIPPYVRVTGEFNKKAYEELCETR